MKKNEIMSRQQKDKVSVSKKQKHLEKLALLSDNSALPSGSMDNGLAVPSSQKNKRFSSLDEYLEVLREKKWKVVDFAKNGYSKHQVSFFNWLLKNPDVLDRDTFIQEYCRDHIELDDISVKYGIPRQHLSFLREYYGIKRIGATGHRRYANETPLTERQKSIFYGCILGDGTVDAAGSFRVKHSVSQKKYIEWIFSEFKNQCAIEDLGHCTTYDQRSGTKVEALAFWTRSHSFFKKIRKTIYGDGQKSVSSSLLENLSPFSLAVLYMNDGSTRFLRNNNGDAFGVECRIYTCSFTYEENLEISSVLQNKFGVSSTVNYKDSKNKKYPFLVFYGADGFRLLEVVRPHICESMKYKVDPDVNREHCTTIKQKTNWLQLVPTKTKFRRLDELDQQEHVERIFGHYRETGFPFIRCSEERLLNDFVRIQNWNRDHVFVSDDTVKLNTNSTGPIWHFQPHMFSMATHNSKTPMEIFVDDELFRDAIFRRLKYGGTCTEAGIRSVLKEYKNNRGVGNFLPSVARAVYLEFCNEDSCVLDFSAGFGGRMLSAMASNIKKYHCIDPLLKNIEGLRAMSNFYGRISTTEVDVEHGTAEDVLPRISDTFDLVFTSPPYHDKEIYHRDDTQCYIRYPNYEDWFEQWLLRIISLSAGLLKSTGRMILSLGKSDKHDIISDLLQNIPDCIMLERVLRIETPVISYRRSNGAKKYERMLVFKPSRKGNEPPNSE